jgi:hypothetical protein
MKKSGFYWVKFKGEYEIASLCGDRWNLIYSQNSYREDDFDEIGAYLGNEPGELIKMSDPYTPKDPIKTLMFIPDQGDRY